jgi:CRP/FNR family transcriptional regulator
MKKRKRGVGVMQNKSPWVKSELNMQTIAERCSSLKRTISQGTLIYAQNDPAYYLHFLLEGRVSVFLINPSGEIKTLAIHEPGSFFGETSFFDHSSYFASAEALVESSILRFDRAMVRELFTSDPRFTTSLLQSLGQKIRLLTFQVESLTFLNLEKRVGAMLLSLFENFGNAADDDAHDKDFHLTVQITDQELAYLVGTRREAVTKAIIKLKNMGFLHKEKRVLHFDDIDALRKFVASDSEIHDAI